MQIIHHSIIMKALSEHDEVRHIPSLVDLTLMGEDYKVNAIRYLVKDVARPLTDYVCFKEYDDDFFLVYCHTHIRADRSSTASSLGFSLRRDR